MRPAPKVVPMRVVIFVFLVVFVTACNPPLTVSQQVIAVIREMETRLENGERRPFIKHVAEDFSGQNGQLNRQELQRLVLFQFNRHQRLNVQLFPITVTETGENKASARFKALITGGPGWIPDQGQLYDFKTRWHYEGGDWILISADWEPLL